MKYFALITAFAVFAAAPLAASADRGFGGGGGGFRAPAPSRGGGGFNLSRDATPQRPAPQPQRPATTQRPSQPAQRPNNPPANNGNRNNVNNNPTRTNVNNNPTRTNVNNNRTNVNNNTNRTNVNVSNNTINRTVINNPVYNGPAWGWNHGVVWGPAYGYYGGGFWGPFAVGVATAAVFGSIVNASHQTIVSYQVAPGSPGATLLQNYGLTQTQCGPPNLVVVYGPSNSVMCAFPNTLVSAGTYNINTDTLSLVSANA